jgi:hypothetical protein
MRSIGYGEGLYLRAVLVESPPSPEIHYANFDLSPQAQGCPGNDSLCRSACPANPV